MTRSGAEDCSDDLLMQAFGYAVSCNGPARLHVCLTYDVMVVEGRVQKAGHVLIPGIESGGR